MGAGIAEVCARAGLDVVVAESHPAAVESGSERLRTSLARAQRKGRIPDAEAALRRIRVTDAIDELSDREIVIEAIVEDENEKVALFRQLDKILALPDAIIASNTSAIPIVKLASATTRPEQVLGVHFFNPVPVLPLVELVPSLLTAGETTSRAHEFVRGALGKRPILCKDRAGFVVNSLLIPFILAAVRMLESGFATRDDIDSGLVHGAAHPQGPLALADLIGLDTTKAIADSLYEEFKEPLYASPPLLVRMVDAGLLGRKNGQGFYSYR
ncbi:MULTISPECIES: 3-hydroxybutyryl-CoA dehydrogenase [Amycolatopsis]